tara:strand:- start:434 stop:760 length:327 start_codon:yes stop_codon:yes gene_type:complete
MKKEIKNMDAYMNAVNRRQGWRAEGKEAHKKSNQLGIFWDAEEIDNNQKLEEILSESENCSLAHNIVVTDDTIEKWDEDYISGSGTLGTLAWNSPMNGWNYNSVYHWK